MALILIIFRMRYDILHQGLIAKDLACVFRLCIFSLCMSFCVRLYMKPFICVAVLITYGRDCS